MLTHIYSMSGPEQQPEQDKKKEFFDHYEMRLSAETGLNKTDQQINELDQPENKLPFICVENRQISAC